ncbi:CBS domain protein [Haloplasma contractile SSD-17B]|uniref:CBS domain protein n=1 Tax=Haloplasma contractile SSD-17B TaxID=1033810 RepID=U2FJZ4_9MOLU|nr:CBS domain protein [Haloplasma contractile SSD-17B]
MDLSSVETYRWVLQANFEDIEIYKVVLLVFLIFLSAFFSSSETAFSSVNLIRLRNYVDEKRRGARKALYIAENFDHTLSAILIGNNLVNIAATTLSTMISVQLYGRSIGPVVATVVMTILILIFGEVLPKSYAKENATRFTLSTGWILLLLIWVFYPLVWILLKFKQLSSRLIKGADEGRPSVTEGELEYIMATMEEEGVLHEDEREMIRSVLDLNETTVYEIMTPRVDIVGVYIDENPEEIKRIFFTEKFSRIPVFEDTVDNVVGILYERDFFTTLIKGEQVDVKKIMRKGLFVPKSMRVDNLMELLQHNKQHMAVVSDEYGGTSGVVTMEDCLEELVGEIYDEHDIEEVEIKQLSDTKFEIGAEVDLEDLFEDLELGKTPESNYSSLGGWLYEKFEEIPQVGDHYEYISEIRIEESKDLNEDLYNHYKLTFTVKELTDRRMKTIALEIENVTEELIENGELKEIEAT